MALSGVSTWSLTRNEIILAALRKLGVLNSASTPEAYEYTDAAVSLNAIVKEISAEGAGLWMRQSTALVLDSGRQRYLLGPSGSHAFQHDIIAANSLSAAEAAAETVISIADASWVDYAGNTASKPTSGNIGIRLSSGAMHWTTIAGVGVDTVTLTAALPSAAASGARVYCHAYYVARPVRVLSCHRVDTGGNVSAVELVGRNDYDALSRKDSSGDPMIAHFDPQMTNAALWVWPARNSTTTDLLIMTTEHYPDDFTAATDNPRFPSEWTNALIWGLAAELAPEYGIGMRERAELIMRAESKKSILLNTADRENASVFFGRAS